jgi:hypothetical protein
VGLQNDPAGQRVEVNAPPVPVCPAISRVHGGALATPFDGTLIGDFTHEIEGEMADHGHVLGSVAYAQA